MFSSCLAVKIITTWPFRWRHSPIPSYGSVYSAVQVRCFWVGSQPKFLRVTIQLKSFKQHFPVVLFTTLHKAIFPFEFANEIIQTIHMMATELSVVLLTMLYKMLLTFEFVDEILKCGHLNDSYRAVLSCGAVYYVLQAHSNFSDWGWNPKV